MSQSPQRVIRYLLDVCPHMPRTERIARPALFHPTPDRSLGASSSFEALSTKRWTFLAPCMRPDGLT